MTDIWFVDPPAPPEGREWCLMCLMQAKDRITAAHPDLPKIAADGKAAVHWVPWDDRIRLMPALCRGLSSVVQLGPVPVCWSHLATASVSPSSSVVPGGMIPPSLLRGRG